MNKSEGIYILVFQSLHLSENSSLATNPQTSCCPNIQSSNKAMKEYKFYSAQTFRVGNDLQP